MLHHDDSSIDDQVLLIRAVRQDGVVTEDGVERLASSVFKESSGAASCFIENEVSGLDGFCSQILPRIEEELSARLRGTATIQAAFVRSLGFAIERRPDEFHGNNAHVVILSPKGLPRNKLDRLMKRLSQDADYAPCARR